MHCISEICQIGASTSLTQTIPQIFLFNFWRVFVIWNLCAPAMKILDSILLPRTYLQTILQVLKDLLIVEKICFRVDIVEKDSSLRVILYDMRECILEKNHFLACTAQKNSADLTFWRSTQWNTQVNFLLQYFIWSLNLFLLKGNSNACFELTLLPSPSASSKFVLSVLTFLGILKILRYTQNIFCILKWANLCREI